MADLDGPIAMLKTEYAGTSLEPLLGFDPTP
jgi:hypothetical protein